MSVNKRVIRNLVYPAFAARIQEECSDFAACDKRLDGLSTESMPYLSYGTFVANS
jgi:hypothetical protein